MTSSKKYTVWYLEKDKFDETDFSWCNFFGIKTRVHSLHCGDKFVGLSIKLITSSDTQAAMLQFKYDYRLIKINDTSLTLLEYDALGFR